ncbi:AAA family ATPase [Frankia sp. Cj3]|uniref:AAA family ATPase n=1 Tax=Frankia sp. Cj3 TaxID=2880976 RepID=UPI001EF4F915|nr:AAA family ATPase [Frankia sp. Cj3]
MNNPTDNASIDMSNHLDIPEEPAPDSHSSLDRPLLTALHIANFKCYGTPRGGTGYFHVPLSALSLIYGHNSAGKSTLLQALLVLSQTLSQAPEQAGQRLVLNGPLVSLGTATDVVYRHETDRVISIGVSWRSTNDSEYSIVCGFDGSSAELLDIRIIEHQPDMPDAKPILLERDKSLEEHLGIGPVLVVAEQSIEPFLKELYHTAKNEVFRDRTEFFSRNRPLVSLTGIRFGHIIAFQGTNTTTLTSSLQRLDGSDTDQQHTKEIIPAWMTYAENFYKGLDNALGGLRYLGPSRAAPSSSPVRLNYATDGVGHDGGNLLNFLAGQSEGDAVVLRTNESLDRLRIPYRIRVWKYGLPEFLDGDEAQVINYRSTIPLADVGLIRNGVESKLSDVGYGFNHLLPILAECNRATSRPLIIEQPETHLNPDLQVELADELIEFATKKQQLLIETHSENILLRIQALVESGYVYEEDVQVITITPAEIDDSAFPRGSRWLAEGQLSPGTGDIFPEARIRAVEPAPQPC